MSGTDNAVPQWVVDNIQAKHPDLGAPIGSDAPSPQDQAQAKAQAFLEKLKEVDPGATMTPHAADQANVPAFPDPAGERKTKAVEALEAAKPEEEPEPVQPTPDPVEPDLEAQAEDGAARFATSAADGISVDTRRERRDALESDLVSAGVDDKIARLIAHQGGKNGQAFLDQWRSRGQAFTAGSPESLANDAHSAGASGALTAGDVQGAHVDAAGGAVPQQLLDRLAGLEQRFDAQQKQSTAASAKEIRQIAGDLSPEFPGIVNDRGVVDREVGDLAFKLYEPGSPGKYGDVRECFRSAALVHLGTGAPKVVQRQSTPSPELDSPTGPASDGGPVTITEERAILEGVAANYGHNEQLFQQMLERAKMQIRARGRTGTY